LTLNTYVPATNDEYVLGKSELLYTSVVTPPSGDQGLGNNQVILIGSELEEKYRVNPPEPLFSQSPVTEN
jgi:hypothetical protein